MNHKAMIQGGYAPKQRKTKDVHEWAHYIENQLRLIRGLDPQTTEK